MVIIVIFISKVQGDLDRTVAVVSAIIAVSNSTTSPERAPELIAWWSRAPGLLALDHLEDFVSHALSVEPMLRG
jgi:hypothetical protein